MLAGSAFIRWLRAPEPQTALHLADLIIVVLLSAESLSFKQGDRKLKNHSNWGHKELLIALGICLLTAAIVGFKVYVLGYSMTTVRDEDGYFVRLIMDARGDGGSVDVRLTQPANNERQKIFNETIDAPGFTWNVTPSRDCVWSAPNLSGKKTITYSFLAQTGARKYPLPVEEAIPTTYTQELQADLAATDRIQTSDSEIRAKAFALAPAGTMIKPALQSIFNYCYRNIRYIKTSGPTDALTAMRLGEASCNGKNRLMTALLRARGIPARIANGLILTGTSKRTTHSWTEVRVGDQWVPLCPTNGYFAEIPETYLELAKGDVALIKHTRHIGFDWQWLVRHQLKQREKAVTNNAGNPLNVLHFWLALKDYHVSMDLIMIILMVPIAATVVALTRNVIGLVPFGTFMPALMAIAFRDTGFILGAGMFVCVIIFGLGVNLLLLRLRLLHVPRLVIIMTVVVASMLGLSIICIKCGLATGAAVSLYPMAIMTLTCERFTQTVITESVRDAVNRLVVSFIVAAACFVVMNWGPLQMIVIAFPELLLLNIAANLVIGSWTGMRLIEHSRFRSLLTDKPEP